MKNKKWFLFIISTVLICIFLLNACGTAEQTFSTEDFDDVPTHFEPTIPLPIETMLPSAKPSPLVEIVDTGVCGENAIWSLDAEGTLTISGTGNIYSYMRYRSDSVDTCEDLSQLTPPWNENYDNQSIKTVVIEHGITSIGVGAFMLCPELTNVSIPASVTDLQDSAFADCPNLTSIELPSGVTKLGSGVFWACTSLNTVFLPDTVTEVGDVAFAECSSLLTIHIMGSSPTTGKQAFFGCSSLTDISYGGTEQQWKDAKLDTIDFDSKDYTIHFSDGSSFHYVYQEPITQETAQIIAYQYWGVDPDAAIKFGSDINPTAGSGISEWNGKTYYSFERYGVGTATYVWASQNEDISIIFVDAVTGEVFTSLP